ncbi:hypothetical protein PMI04_004095 [Sphingobium sp. AP49]|uniref:hypothetical protein n=1 Tax=Sphingobium sp. AP49 TaxID=1144307 RepID=UPI00026EDF0D|nr:hypothetical protein [Sphingobium sp. AP49]WHO39781.1 hypothetical protein PMI04_004095 [Sphingobium sp. AP49]
MLLRTIEKFLHEQNIAATRFGRESVRDPRLVHDIRHGREPGERVKRRIEHFMNEYRRSAGQ